MMTTRNILPGQTNPAIKSGPVPVLRDWRSLGYAQKTRAERAMTFAEKFLVVPEGKLVGQPLKLAWFQEQFFYAIFDNEVHTRRAILSMARKNAKTATIAIIVLVFLAGPEAIQNSRISSGALSRDQAGEVYNYAAKMAALSPKLSGRVRAVPSSKKLIGLMANVEYRALAAEGKTAHGGSPLVVIIDEAGQVEGPYSAFFEALTTSQGAYEKPLEIWISTQAKGPGDLFNMMIDDAEMAGDLSTVCHVYAAPDDCKLADEDAWRAANPALGLFKSEDEVRAAAKSAARMPTAENTFRWLHLNQRVTSDSPFISRGAWEACARDPDARAFVEGEVWAGLDLSQTTDLTAFVMAALWQGEWHVRPTFFMAEGLIDERAKADRVPYGIWRDQGYIIATPGKSVALDWVAHHIVEACGEVALKTMAFDRWRMDQLKIELERLGADLPMEPFGQGFASMSPALQALEEAVLHEKLRHGGHPVLTMCARNSRAIMDPAGNRKLDKQKASGRIDGMVALAMALGAAGRIGKLLEEEPQPMVYVL